MKNQKYEFLVPSESRMVEEEFSEVEDFIDFLYIKRQKNGSSTSLSCHLQIRRFLDVSLKEVRNIDKTVLLLYFLEENLENYDTQLKQMLIK